MLTTLLKINLSKFKIDYSDDYFRIKNILEQFK